MKRQKDKETLIKLIRRDSLHKEVQEKRHHVGFREYYHTEELSNPYHSKETMERLTIRLLDKMKFVHDNV